MDYVLYTRKSIKDSSKKQALSINSHVKEILAIAEHIRIRHYRHCHKAYLAKNSGRWPVFLEILKNIRREQFNGIIVWHPDRLTRNTFDLGSLVDLMDQKRLVEIRTYGQAFTNTPSEKVISVTNI